MAQRRTTVFPFWRCRETVGQMLFLRPKQRNMLKKVIKLSDIGKNLWPSVGNMEFRTKKAGSKEQQGEAVATRNFRL